MRRSLSGAAIAIIAVVAIILVWMSTFVVDPTEQALVLRFGQPVRDLIGAPLFDLRRAQARLGPQVEVPDEDVRLLDLRRAQPRHFPRIGASELVGTVGHLRTTIRT